MQWAPTTKRGNPWSPGSVPFPRPIRGSGPTTTPPRAGGGQERDPLPGGGTRAGGRATGHHEDVALIRTTRTSTLNLQPRIGGDMALLRGMAKAVLEQSSSDPKVLDVAFIDRHTSGFEEYRELCEATPWEELEHQSGLSRADILKAAQVYGEADRSIVSWCLGLTQHEHGVDTVREIVNLLLLRGNLGREGAGPSPCAATATSRATARAASITVPPTRSWTGSPRRAGSTRPASTAWTPSVRSRRCGRAR